MCGQRGCEKTELTGNVGTVRRSDDERTRMQFGGVGVANANRGATGGRREKTRTADTAISYRGGPESRRRHIGSLRGSVRYGFNNSAGRTDTVWAACAAAGSRQTNYNFRQMRHPVLGSIQNQAVCRWLSRRVRRRRRDDYCDSFAVRKQ